MAELKKGDQVRAEGYGEGVIIEAHPSNKQLYKKDKSDEGRTVQVVTVQLDGDQKLRGFPVDILKKI